MNDSILNMGHKYLSELYSISEGRTWNGNNEKVHCDTLKEKLNSVFSLPEMLSGLVLNTWLLDNGMEMHQLEEYWSDTMKKIREEEASQGRMNRMMRGFE